MHAPAPGVDSSLDAAFRGGPACTFIDREPAHESTFVLWTTRGIDDPDDVAELVRPDEAGGVAATLTPVRTLSPAELLDLAGRHRAGGDELDAASPSAKAWLAVADAALVLVARGRLRPGLGTSGLDTWQLAPDAHETRHLAALAAALPAAAYCAPVDNGRAMPHTLSSELAVRRAADALADSLVRTAGADLAAGHRAFAARVPSPIDSRRVLDDLFARSEGRSPLLALRIEPPHLDDGDFVGRLVLQSRGAQRISREVAALWMAPEDLRRSLHGLEHQILSTLRRAARVWPRLATLLEHPTPTTIPLSENDVQILAGELTNDLGATGLGIEWPDDLVSDLELAPVLGRSAAGARHGARTQLDLASLVELSWRASAGGAALSAEDLRRLAASNQSVVRLRGRWVRVDAEQLRRLRRPRTVTASAALAAALGGNLTIDGVEAEIEIEGPLATLGDRLRDRDPLHELEAPTSMSVELRPYQKRGLGWLAEMDELGLGGILADDMGLGKTVQLLALHVHRSQADGVDARPTLVVCPTSVVGNWGRETNRFAPEIPVIRYHGSDRSLDDLAPNAVVLTSYGVARRDASRLASVEWGLLVADEAQTIKNPTSRTAKALRTIPARSRFALTGTPIQNQLDDLWALLDWTTPGLLGPLSRFRKDIAAPIERGGDTEASARLNRLLRPFLLRRRKTDPTIAPDLPPKTETDEVVPLTAEQATLYQEVVDQVMAEIAAATGIERRGLVLRLVTRLKQVCNHPAHLLGEDDPKNGELAGRSGKLEATTNLLRTITQGDEAALVFTQYVAMGRLLQAHVTAQGHTVTFLHGGLDLNARENMVDAFQRGDHQVLIVSLRAGGTGLNLTAATHVIHFDRWWNPAVEDQASDRAWRIGQDRPVQIHRLISEGTIEDRIAALLADKRAIAEAVVGGGEGWISELNDDELAELVRLGTAEDEFDPPDDDGPDEVSDDEARR